MTISGIQFPQPQWQPASAIAPPAGGVGSAQPFADLLTQSWQQVREVQASAQDQMASAMVSEDPPLVETFTAVRESDLALRLMIQVRNKLVDAWQELQNLRM